MSLPNTYLQLEYIESTGTQYIDTNYVGTSGTKVITKMSISNIENDKYFYGSQKTGYYLNLGIYNNLFRAQLGTSIQYPTITPEANKVYDFEEYVISGGSSYLKIDGTAVVENNDVVNDNNVNFYIFCLGSNKYGYSKIKLFSQRIFTNDTLVRDFIPAMRLSDKVVGLYDLVNDIFYTNSGTGTFKFAFLNDEDAYSVIKNCAYLQTSGTQFIDTLVDTNSDRKFVLEYENISGRELTFGSSTSIRWGYDTSYYRTPNRYVSGPPLSTKNIRYKVEGSWTTLIVNGVNVNLAGDTNSGAGTFAIGKHGNTICGTVKIYSFKMYDVDGTTLIRNMQPVVLNNVGYLYDKVEHKLYGNDGTGSFTYGNILDIEINPEDGGLVERYYEDGKLNLLAIPNSGFKFKDWLLKGYTQLEYIESTGTQWIDTGYTPKNTNKIEIKTKLLSTTTTASGNGVYGSYDDLTQGTGLIGLRGKFYAISDTSFSTTNINLTTDELLIIHDSNGIKINNNTYAHGIKTTNVDIFIFDVNANGSKYGADGIPQRLNYFKIYDDDTLVRDFIPVIRHSDGQIGLLDLVELKFYGNSGTGVFIGGDVYAS